MTVNGKFMVTQLKIVLIYKSFFLSTETLQYHPTLPSGEILETNKTDFNFKLLSQVSSSEVPRKKILPFIAISYMI